MLKLLSISLLLMGYCCFQQAPPRVVRKMRANLMPASYDGVDTIINYRGKRYAVNLIEDYDEKGELKKVSIFKGIGYLEFYEKHIIHDQKFQDPYQLRDTLEYRRLKNNKVQLNGVLYLIKGREKGRLYLVRSSQKDELYILEFKP